MFWGVRLLPAWRSYVLGVWFALPVTAVNFYSDLKLELILTHMTQKPELRVGVFV